MKRSIVLYSAIILLCVAILWSAKYGIDKSDLGARLYRNSDQHFTILPPAGWIRAERSEDGALAFFMAKKSDRDGDGILTPTISVLSDSLRGLSEKEYLDESKYNLASNTKLYTQVEEIYGTDKYATAYILGGRYVSDGNEVRNKQLFVFSDQKVFIVTGTALASRWEIYDEMITKSLLSFTLER